MLDDFNVIASWRARDAISSAIESLEKDISQKLPECMDHHDYFKKVRKQKLDAIGQLKTLAAELNKQGWEASLKEQPK